MEMTTASGLRRAARTRIWLCATSLLLTAASCYSQEGECRAGALDCFPYRDTRVVLVYSTLYETVTLPSNATANHIEVLEARIEDAGIGIPELFPSLADDRAIVIQLRQDGAAPGDPAPALERLDRVIADFNSEYFAGQQEQVVAGRNAVGNPVYSSDGANFVMVNEVIVQFVPGSNETERLALLRMYEAEITQDHSDHNWYLVTIRGLNAREALGVSNTIHYEAIVEFAQPGFVELIPRLPGDGGASAPLPTCPATLPGLSIDPLFAQQWYLNNNGSGGTQFADVNAVKAWQITTGDQSTVIAIIDDGVAQDHVDLATKFVAGYDAYGGDNDPTPNPWDGHGTAVAGIAAAVTGNPFGIKGIGSDVAIMAVRVYAYATKGAYGADMPHPVIKAGIETAADNAHVLNNSWVRSESMVSNLAIESAIDYALNKGRVVVFAVGNEGGAVRYPAKLANTFDVTGKPRAIIAVGATDPNDQALSWSNSGGGLVTVVAPGLELVTTDIMGTTVNGPNGYTGINGYCAGDYAVFSGTSAAAPLVSGTAALILSKTPGLLPQAVRDRLENTAVDLVPAGYDDKTGHGRIDACLALQGTNCNRAEPPEPPVDRTPSPPSSLTVDPTIVIVGVSIFLIVFLAYLFRKWWPD